MSTPTTPGWYDDPEDDTKLRYFDGVVWSKHTTPRSTRPAAAAPQPGQQQFPGQGHPPQYPGQGAGQAPAQPPAQPPATGGWQAPSAPQPGQQHPQFPGAQQPGGWNAPAYPGLRRVATTPDGQPLAGYGQRVGAFILDWLLQTFIAGLLGSYFLVQAFSRYFDQVSSMMNTVQGGGQPDFNALMDSIDSTQLMYFSVVSIVVFAAYQYFFLTRSGQTPGKMATGISVRLRERPGPPPSAVVLRRIGLPIALFVLQIVPLVGTIAGLARLLDLLWPAWDERKQALHDKVAGTNVVVGKQPKRS
jgi:uncharacterized RDD family membrane protein YckC